MPTLSDVRSTTSEEAESALVIFIEGIPYAWVTDHTGDALLGSGAGSWIGAYEADASYTAHETAGERSVVSGLVPPPSIPRGNLNPNTGLLESTSVSFDIVDHDGLLASLFANEGKAYNLLGERVAPGTSALGATIITQEDAALDPADKYIGIERIGPARERRWFYPFPWQGIGIHHQRHPNGNPDLAEGPPNVLVSDDPIVHAGRIVSLWRVYRTGEIPGLVFDPPMLGLDDPISGEAATLDGTTYNSTNKTRVFDGATDRIDYTTSPYDIDPGDPVSVAFWVYIQDFSNSPRIWNTQRSAGSTGPLVDVLTDGSVRLYITNDGGTSCHSRTTGTGAVSTNTWHHVCVTYDGSNTQAGILFYVDGVNIANGSGADGTGTARHGGHSWHLGGYLLSDAFCLDGEILGARAYDRVLSAAEVAEEYASHNGWPHWGDQYDAGSLEWWGVLQDRGEFQGNGRWRIQCWGPESLLRRKMATNDVGWMPVNNVSAAPTSDKRYVAVAFKRTANQVANSELYDSGHFTALAEADYDSADELATAISGYLQDYADGTSSDFGPDGDFVTAGGSVSFARNEVRIKALAPAVSNVRFHMDLCAHEETWRRLGWDLEAQGTHQVEVQTGTTQVVAKKLEPGEVFSPHSGPGQAAKAPGYGYWTLTFHTVQLGYQPFGPGNLGDDVLLNSQGWRSFLPKFHGDPAIFSASAGQAFTVTHSYPYVEPDPMVVDDAYDAARWFLFKGKRSMVIGGEVVTEDEYQVAKVQWDYDASSNYGTVAEDATNGSPSFYLHSWAMPRAFNVDRPRFDGDWASVAGTEYEIQCRPLHCYSYRTLASDGVPFERSWAVLGQLLLGTGTGSGWDDITTLHGDNAPPTATGDLTWISDVVGSEMGLGIPYQLVQDPQDLYDAFDLGEFGDQHAGLNEVRYTYSEPFESTRLIESVIRPRGLAMTLRGGKYSVSDLRLFDPGDADHTINETEVHGEPSDPTTVVPSQQLRATGPIDAIELEAGHNPAEEKFNVEVGFPARDIGAKWRRGDITDRMAADGLIPERFRYQNGQGNMIGSPWLDAFRRMWAFDLAEWRASRHFIVSLRLHRVAGQDVWPGDRVRFSNRWVFNPSGSLGVTGAIGVVLESSLEWEKGQRDQYMVRVLVFADQFDGFRLFSPVARINVDDGYTGGTAITLDEDAAFLVHGAGDDGDAFAEPSWSNVGGNATVCVLEHDRGTWTLHSGDTQTVSAASGTSVTLSGSFSTTFHAYSDKYLVLVDYDSQAASNWVRSLMLPIVLGTHVFGGSSTDGWPFVNA